MLWELPKRVDDANIRLMSTSVELADRAWDDPSWIEKSDNAWQAGLRWQQSWWRAKRLQLPAGPFSAAHPHRLVASTLALDAPANANFITVEAAEAALHRLEVGGGGLVKEDRLRRVLLSSQPMCFNLFGHFQREDNRNGLLGWVRRVSPGARHVARIELEWAPPAEDHFKGGSAFDAFLEYERADGSLGFLGIECKYHEDLRKTDVPKVRDVYRDFTAASGLWHDGASDRLDRTGCRQFWLNTLLAQSLLTKDSRYSEGTCVIMSCAADRAARAAFDTVQAELVDNVGLRWEPWDVIVSTIEGHDDWRELFVERYLDFTPIRQLLAPGDARAGASRVTRRHLLGVASPRLSNSA